MAPDKTGNSLLDALPPDSLLRLQPLLTGYDLSFGRDIHEPGEILQYAYFPTGGLISVVAAMDDGTSVEIHMVGREGMFGVSSVLGDDRPGNRAMVQIAGHALRMKADVLQREIATDLSMQRLLLRYTCAVFASVGQSAACNRLHQLEQRCARWLLGCSDRAESDRFEITQDFLAMMLGVHRPGVTLAAQSLQSDGLITYNHGSMRIVDRKGLEARSCECYGAIRDEFKRLLRRPPE